MPSDDGLTIQIDCAQPFYCFRKQLWGNNPILMNKSLQLLQTREGPFTSWRANQLHLPLHLDVWTESSHVLLSGSDLNVLTAKASDGLSTSNSLTSSTVKGEAEEEDVDPPTPRTQQKKGFKAFEGKLSTFGQNLLSTSLPSFSCSIKEKWNKP